MKCRRNHPGSNIKICSFNSSHHIPDDQLREHERNCPDAMKIVAAAASSFKSRSPIHSSLGSDEPPQDPDNENNEDEENWENDLVKSSYDPTKAAAGKVVLRKIEGATPSQRREFRRKEKERHDQLHLMKSLERDVFYSGGGETQGRGILFRQMKMKRSEDIVRKDLDAIIMSPSVPDDEKKMKGVSGSQEKTFVVKGRGRVRWKKEN